MENHLFLEVTTSTNAALNEMLNKPLSEGFILQTNFQSKGKGQGTNAWESEPGKNLLFSILFYPDFLSPAKQFLLSKAVALALVEVCNQITEGFRVKWPNDIYFGDKKLAGILIETAIMGSKLSHAIVGVGLNVNQDAFFEAPNPISLKQVLKRELDIEAIMVSVRKALAKKYQLLKTGKVDDLNRQYHQLLYRREGTWPFKDDRGIFHASILKVEEEGQLVLKTKTGEMRRYWMKEVEFMI